MAAEAPGAAVERMLQEHRRAGGCMVVGYSGGADSSLLLALAVRHCPAGINLRALHVNHGLHAQSGDWEEHCRAFADKLGVPIEVVRSRIRAGRGIEDKARQARLRAFAGTDADAIVLAHHADDQIETFLLRALRGAGIRGLAGINAVRRLPAAGGKLLLRPLLPFPAARLRTLARRLRLDWVEDPSNAQVEVNRNWLRNEVLVQAQQRFPGAAAALAAAAANAQEAAGLLDELAAADDQEARDERGRLRRSQLAKLGQPRLRNWLLWNFVRRGMPPPAQRHLGEIARQIAAASAAGRLFARGQLQLVARGDVLHWQE